MSIAESSNKYVCSICKGTFLGYGNNARPVNNETCCDYCNATQVIPARVNAKKFILKEDSYSPKVRGGQK